MNVRSSLILLLAVTGFSMNAAGQATDRYIELARARSGSNISHEAFTLPSSDSTANVLVTFTIPHDRLVFMRHQEESSERSFRAEINVTVSLYDRDEMVDEAIWKADVFAEDFDATTNRAIAKSGVVSFKVPPGQYAYALRFNDQNTERTASSLRRPVNVPNFTNAAVSEAIIADTVAYDDMIRIARPTGLSGNIRYGSFGLALIPFSLETATSDPPVVEWTLRRLDDEIVAKEREKRQEALRERRRQRRGEDGDPAPIERELTLKGGRVVNQGKVDRDSIFAIQAFSSDDMTPEGLEFHVATHSNYFLALVDFGAEHLEDGTYVLDAVVETDGRELERSTRFSTRWVDMPVSLLDIDVAIKNLHFIADRKTVRELRDGSKEEKIEKFRSFWEKRDPTPGTAFNELMSEYYRRIDYAALEFRTGPGFIPNGLATDRARIYVVHGPPEEITRSFPEKGGVLETWRYSDGRLFTFESQSSVDAFQLVDAAD